MRPSWTGRAAPAGWSWRTTTTASSATTVSPWARSRAWTPTGSVYLGTASKSLAPGLRLAWMVLPPGLVEEVTAAKGGVDTCGALDQLTLAEFLASGAYDRHVRAHAPALPPPAGRRWSPPVTAGLPAARVTGIAAGLHVVLRLPPGTEQSVVQARPLAGPRRRTDCPLPAPRRARRAARRPGRRLRDTAGPRLVRGAGRAVRGTARIIARIPRHGMRFEGYGHPMSDSHSISRVALKKITPDVSAAMGSLHARRRFRGAGRQGRTRMLELVRIRASQINGCAFCLDMHTKDARAQGETEQRIYALNAWRETPFFTERERAALALTEAVTLVHDGRVPDAVYAEAAEVFDEDADRGVDLGGHRHQRLQPDRDRHPMVRRKNLKSRTADKHDFGVGQFLRPGARRAFFA